MEKTCRHPTLRCLYADTLLSCCVLMYANAGSTNHIQLHHLCTCDSDPHVRVQGFKADEAVPPSAESFSQSAKTDKNLYPLLLRNLRFSNTWLVCPSVPYLTKYSGDCHSLKHLACTTWTAPHNNLHNTQEKMKYVTIPLQFFIFFWLRIIRLCIIFLHKLCIIVLHKLCIISLHKLCILIMLIVCIIRQEGPFSRSAPLREDVRELGLRSEG